MQVPPAEERNALELLRDYVQAQSEEAAAAALSQLFENYISPWCVESARRTVRSYGLRGGDRVDEESELVAEVVLQMTGRLREIRTNAAAPIANLRAYAVSAVYNSCFARIRERCPRHVQLQNRLRYLLRNDRDFALWTPSDGEPLAGFSQWTGRQDSMPPPVMQRSGESLKLLLRGVFELAQAPVRLSDLTAVAAESLGISDSPVLSLTEHGNYTANEPGADRLMMDRESLDGLWKEVLGLPRAQRCALLLNLRDAGGHGVIELIPATGTATFAELAEALDLTSAALAGIWPELPWEDARIAEMLGLSRQQVINLRKSGRDRLFRRQRKASGNTRDVSASGLLSLADEKIRSFFGRGRSTE